MEGGAANAAWLFTSVTTTRSDHQLRLRRCVLKEIAFCCGERFDAPLAWAPLLHKACRLALCRRFIGQGRPPTS
jgi:hypothetical protein